MKSQSGVALAEWLLASVIGLILMMAAVAWLSSSWQLALAQRQTLQTANAGQWALQRLRQRAEWAGFGGVHPPALGNPRVSACPSHKNRGSRNPLND